MNSNVSSVTPPVADLVAYVDEAGEKGYLRELDPTRDDAIGVMCALPIPQQHLAYIQTRIAPLFDRFKNAAPPNAKLHITEAFKAGHEAWRTVAEEVRASLFDLLIEVNCVVLYVARRCAVARRSFETAQHLIEQAKTGLRGPVRIVGANRPSDETIDDNIMSTLGLMLDEFVEQEGMQRVDIRFDQIDAPLAQRYAAQLEETRQISSSQRVVHGWDSQAQQKVAGVITMSAESGFPLDTRHLGNIDVVGKNDPLVFAVDVVVNSLWRHLKTLPPNAPLNDGASVDRWALGDRVWGKDAPKNWDNI